MAANERPALAAESDEEPPYSAIVLVVSSRAADGLASDTTGPRIAEALRSWDFLVENAIIIADGAPVGRTLAWAAGHFDLIITTGGTGLSADDRTPEETRALLDRELPGIPELLRSRGVSKGVQTAVLSRGVAGTIGGCLVVNLPGSPNAVEDALEMLGEILPHALDQMHSSARARAGHPARGLSAAEAREILNMPHVHPEHSDKAARSHPHLGEGATVVELPRPVKNPDEGRT